MPKADAHAGFAADLARAGLPSNAFGPKKAQIWQVDPRRSPPPPAAASAAPSPAILPQSDGVVDINSRAVSLGETELGSPFSIDLERLLDGRLLIQGVSGAGKSYLLRRLIEQVGQRLPQIVIDKEGEFDTLAEEMGWLYVAAHRLNEDAMAKLAYRLREQRVSIVLDFSELNAEDRLAALPAFLSPLIYVPKELWTTALVAIDEAHVFAPYGAHEVDDAKLRQRSIAAMANLMSLGRKRGLVGVLASTRLARLAKSVASEVQNFLVGMNTLDLDIKRAGETIGWGARRASDRLPLLPAGTFVAVGHAFSQSPTVAKIGPVRSRHKGSRPAITPPQILDRGAAQVLLGVDELVAASEVAEIEEATPPAVRSPSKARGRKRTGCRDDWAEAELAILRAGLAADKRRNVILDELRAAGFERSLSSVHGKAFRLRHEKNRGGGKRLQSLFFPCSPTARAGYC